MTNSNKNCTGYSRTWILCAGEVRSRVFRLDTASENITCVNDIAGGADPGALAREAEFACGFGTKDTIVLCGDFRLINRICQNIDPKIRGRISGIIPRDLTGESPETVRAQVRPKSLRQCA
jgi:hypothetical protein